METGLVVGPARNLIDFAKRARETHAGVPPIEVCIATYRRRGSGPEFPFAAAVREAGLPAEVISEKHAFDFGAISQLERIIALRQPHIVQTHNVKSHLFIRLLSAWRSRPWVVFQHGYTNKDLRDRIYNQLDRWTLRKACRVVSVCQAFSGRLQRWGVPASRIVVLHNPVRPFIPPDALDVDATRQELALEPGTFIVLAVGRLSREKGHRDLLEAAAILRGLHPSAPVRFVLVGDGPERRALAARSDELGLQADVTFTGQKHDVRPFYALAGIVVLPSHSEGSPNVILEAMAAGVPVVATAVGGVPEMVTDAVTGLLVPSRNPTALASALARLIADDELRHKLAASASLCVKTKHSQAEYCRSLAGVYQEAISSFCGPNGEGR